MTHFYRWVKNCLLADSSDRQNPPGLNEPGGNDYPQDQLINFLTGILVSLEGSLACKSVIYDRQRVVLTKKTF